MHLPHTIRALCREHSQPQIGPVHSLTTAPPPRPALEERPTQRTARRVRAVEPFEETARVEPVLARPAGLGGQRPVREGYDAARGDQHGLWLTVEAIPNLRVANRALDDALKVQRHILLEHCKSLEHEAVLSCVSLSQGWTISRT
jgi:hypothetical protein